MFSNPLNKTNLVFKFVLHTFVILINNVSFSQAFKKRGVHNYGRLNDYTVL